MTTHYHLLVDVDHNALQPGMHRLNGPYAQRFNAGTGGSGHLRGDRYARKPVEVATVIMLHALTLHRAQSGRSRTVRTPVRLAMEQLPRLLPSYDDGFPFVDSAPLRAYFGRIAPQPNELLRSFVGESRA